MVPKPLVWLGALALLACTEAAYGAPPLPKDAEPVASFPVLECDDTLVIRYAYRTQEGGTIVTLGEADKPARVTLKYHEAPGEGGVAYEVYDRDEPITMDTLRERYPDVCDMFEKT